MGVVSTYRNDIFISYSHIDNESFGGDRGGWVDIFHAQLQNFVDVHVGRRTKVWRDKRLTGAEIFSDEIEQELRSSAVLVTVISPGYLQSEWCNRELMGFADLAQQRGDLAVGNLQRVVKVLRLPVERSALPPLLDVALGTQFFRVDAASGRARDLLVDESADAERVFRARVDDVAQDLNRAVARDGGVGRERHRVTAAMRAPTRSSSPGRRATSPRSTRCCAASSRRGTSASSRPARRPSMPRDCVLPSSPPCARRRSRST